MVCLFQILSKHIEEIVSYFFRNTGLNAVDSQLENENTMCSISNYVRCENNTSAINSACSEVNSFLHWIFNACVIYIEWLSIIKIYNCNSAVSFFSSRAYSSNDPKGFFFHFFLFPCLSLNDKIGGTKNFILSVF